MKENDKAYVAKATSLQEGEAETEKNRWEIFKNELGRSPERHVPRVSTKEQ